MPCPSDLVNGSCTVTLPWHLAICCGMPVTLHLCILPSILGRGCPARKWSGIDFFLEGREVQTLLLHCL